jgi:hypothetical protein
VFFFLFDVIAWQRFFTSLVQGSSGGGGLPDGVKRTRMGAWASAHGASLTVKGMCDAPASFESREAKNRKGMLLVCHCGNSACEERKGRAGVCVWSVWVFCALV